MGPEIIGEFQTENAKTFNSIYRQIFYSVSCKTLEQLWDNSRRKNLARFIKVSVDYQKLFMITNIYILICILTLAPIADGAESSLSEDHVTTNAA